MLLAGEIAEASRIFWERVRIAEVQLGPASTGSL